MLRTATFPAGFVWGAATSAYQVEGARKEDGKSESIWDRFTHTPGTILDGSTGDVACDQYHRYPDDIALLRQLGLGAYRFSIAWSRVVPDVSGKVNQSGLDHYDRLVDELLAHDIVPYPTLYHWDLPQWVQDAGGWADRAVIGRFAEYVDAVVRSLGDRVATWTVLNEPEVFVREGHHDGTHAPGIRDPDLALRVGHVVNLAHAEGIRAARAAASHAAVGSAFNTAVAYPASEDAEDLAAAERHHALVNAWFLDPLVRGTYPVAFLDQDAALAKMDIRPGDMESMASTFDFIALNMYSRAIVAADPANQRHGTRLLDGPGRKTSFGWEVWPAALHRLVMRFDRDYGHPPIYITENGCAEATAPGRRRARSRRGSGRLPQRAHRTAGPRDRRRLRRARVPRLVAARQLRMGGRLHATVRRRVGRLRSRPAPDRQGQRLVVARPRRKGAAGVRRQPGLTGADPRSGSSLPAADLSRASVRRRRRSLPDTNGARVMRNDGSDGALLRAQSTAIHMWQGFGLLDAGARIPLSTLVYGRNCRGRTHSGWANIQRWPSRSATRY